MDLIIKYTGVEKFAVSNEIAVEWRGSFCWPRDVGLLHRAPIGWKHNASLCPYVRPVHDRKLRT